ncbi:Rieske 2Fe-2S domain-containing protein [Burkholderia ubonensis]|uniref:Rieske 2Fe-2S domain-containing protein n=1 Tax=Burkholderia ubonensis TaxID=101571 RepID=UPI0005D7DD46|nr:Rieske 2Fe-2S domain-containing protein [Burkholderia ubonensis]AJX14534.1 rieske [2Fe-2S] domain protein [Burkholderia ubonensis MSMB22]
MLTKQDNELMCRTGAGTAMGGAMRRFWLPVIQSSDLPPPNGDPKTIELLGQRFVVWRDQDGRPGLYDEGCLHRGASMQLARADGDGLRCIYHGWKFAVDGTVLETPNVPDPKFKERLKGRTYPVREAGGLMWTYLGPRDKEPPFPHRAFMDQPDSHRINVCAIVNCNFVQVIEGLVDSSHLSVLHSSALAQTNHSNLDYAGKITHMQFDAAPTIEADETDFGFHYVAIRQAGENRIARVTSFIAPSFIANANGDVWLAAVPINDERCYFFHVWWDAEKPIGEEPLRSAQLTFVGLDEPTLRKYGMTLDTCDSPAAMSFVNGYRQDRQSQRNGHFTGFDGITQEDAACSISSGPIRDRSQEMLSSADLAISRLHRTLLACARAQRDQQDIPALRADSGRAIGISAEVGPGEDWRQLVPHHRIVSPSGARTQRNS